MIKKRPVNLAINTFKFPVMAIISILHRMSGLLLAFMIPGVLFVLALSLKSEASFALVQNCLSNPISKFFIWGFLVALLYHLIAGIRHMIMDLGFGESVGSAQKSSWFLVGLMVIVCFAIGGWLW